MTSWILQSISAELIEQAQTEAARRLLNNALGIDGTATEDHNLRFVYETMELAVIDLLDDEQGINSLRQISADAFHILRVLPRPESSLEGAKACLRLACLGVIGERGVDARRVLKEMPWAALPLDSALWGERTLATILEVWLRIIRKDGWDDLDAVQAQVIALRQQQANYEAEYLNAQNSEPRTAAWELVALYHLSKAAELLAIFTTQGEIGGRFDARQQLEAQFDRALIACGRAELIELDSMVRLLARTAQQLVDNCIWTVTRAVNSRVTRFVHHLVSRETSKPIFEMLPPQRRTLREEGLLGSGHRAVVVNLPTSSGKTFIAEFRILQALNQFDHEKGWVAYLAPTRALVNQVTTRLRRDFASLSINVEKVSPALEVDGLEASLLTDRENTSQFRVLVTTPEKLDLMLRGGWEETIGRPLTLVVVDEAHNLAQKKGRGIKLELLLATINRECRYAQFLLLTPFIPNAGEIARWLAPDSHNDIELGLDWRPNDRAIVLSHPREGTRRGDFSLELETIHTSKQTLCVPENMSLSAVRPLGVTWSQAKGNASKLAAATAQVMKDRGPVIVLARTIPDTWSLAENFKHPLNKLATVHDDIQMVQRYLAWEFGEGFALCELLEYGVGVHHSGLSDEAKGLIEWLFEREMISVLVSTTTIAQGVNFPVSGVVMAAHQYPGPPPVNIPPEDFWNLAGRAGRVDHGSVGIVALASTDEQKAIKLREYVGQQVSSLNSTLIDMVQEAMRQWGQLELHLLYKSPEWSAFLQYLAHTYRQIGDPQRFASEIEQVLRGTLGFQALRRTRSDLANRLVASVQSYGERIHGKSLKLVDTTGFSWESVSITLSKLASERINEEIWDASRLFGRDNSNLRKLMGILLSVPELRENLEAATGGRGADGDRLACMVRDWVNGANLPDMAQAYFATKPSGETVEPIRALTDCCKNVFGKLTQTASWGLSALQAMTFGDDFDQLNEADQQTLRNLPARVFYGVNTDEAIALRLLGVPRGAAQPLAQSLGAARGVPLPQLRAQLAQADAGVWTQALGSSGQDYFRIWKVLEGVN
ncbi:DEAD/DEAH box helicase [Geobacter sulfurreducens]|uniref:DEAD/DEAH box helicase n=1 Tax=Geobacter sulfurreducens TaxID=35554 RepID=UPI001BDCE803|nr:DEAD/DEAH box helicase [Geobacter sulfurreducens]QVW35182.1 DEAD/DEAH box helicase [Geobacter sulfurreducens]